MKEVKGSRKKVREKYLEVDGSIREYQESIREIQKKYERSTRKYQGVLELQKFRFFPLGIYRCYPLPTL
jgi:hypothetical protein